MSDQVQVTTEKKARKQRADKGVKRGARGPNKKKEVPAN